jgi:hypothetical protein
VPRQTAAYIRTHLPEVAARTIADADRALAGMLVLPGTGAQPYYVGDPPDWYANPVNDNEFLWLLNRHGHWRSLLSAYSLTDDPRYAEKVIQEARDWIERCPRPAIVYDPDLARATFRTVTPWRSLETGIRMFESWPLVLEHLADSDLLAADFLREYTITLYEHGEALAELTPILFPRANHNMQIMQNLGLLTIANLLPELKTASAWKTHAIRELEHGAEVQITDGGGQIEGCPHYHNVCLHYLSRAQLLLGDRDSASEGERFSNAYVERVRRGLDYSTYAFRPSGTGVPWGDSDADLRAVTASLYGGLAFGHWGPFRQISQLAGHDATLAECLKSAWRITDLPDWLDRFDVQFTPPAVPLPTVRWHRELGQVTMRTDWTRNASSVFFACHTPTSDSGHAHIDPMGFDFTAWGRPLVVDPGRFCYRQDEDRRTFKTAAYHNLLTIDWRDPYQYLASGRNERPKYGDIVRTQVTDGMLAAEAVQHNYEPAIHRRLVAIVDDLFLLVLDRLSHLDDGRTVQIYYHVDSPHVIWDQSQNAAFSDEPSVNVAIFATPNLRGELLDGRVSDFLDQARPSRRVLLQDTITGPSDRTYAAVIVPYRTIDLVPDVANFSVGLADEMMTCSFSFAESMFSFDWGDAGILRRAD